MRKSLLSRALAGEVGEGFIGETYPRAVTLEAESMSEAEYEAAVRLHYGFEDTPVMIVNGGKAVH